MYSSRELYTLLLGIFAAIALTIAAVGLYSISAPEVSTDSSAAARAASSHAENERGRASETA